MAFTVVPDKSSGDPVTLAMWDSIKDNLNKGVMRPISTTEVTGSPAASIVFSGIAADWLDLLVVGSTVFNLGGTVTRVRLNGDTGTNYLEQGFTAVGAVVTPFSSSLDFVECPGRPWVYLPNYTSTSTHKHVLSAGSDGFDLFRSSGVWRNTAAVTSVTLFPNGGTWDVGTRMTLYGIAGV